MAFTALGDGLGVIRGDATQKGLALDKIAIFVCDPITNGVGTRNPAVMSREKFRGNTTFVGTVWTCAMTQKGEDDLGVTICGSEMKRCRTGCTDDGSGRGTCLIRVTTRQSGVR